MIPPLGRIVAIALAASFAAPRVWGTPAQDIGKDLIEVSGTVVVENGDGAGVNNESGTIVLGVHEGNTSSNQRALLVEGEWRTKVPVGSTLSFDLFMLESGTARWVVGYETNATPPNLKMRIGGLRANEVAIPKDRRIAVRARLVPPTRLHVVDVESGKELEHVLVLDDLFHDLDRSTNIDPHFLGPQQIHPTTWWQSDVRAQDAASPIPLTVNADSIFPLTLWRDDLWVRSPGYCWGSVNLDYATGGDTTLKLSRGGTLTVNVEGEPLPAVTRIVVRRALGVGLTVGNGLGHEHDSCAEWPLEPSNTVTFDALPPGEYRVSAEVGRWFQKKLSFATTNVSVTANGNVTATLHTSNVPKIPEKVSLRGSLRIDSGWDKTPLSVEVIALETSPFFPRDHVHFRREQLVRDGSDPSTWRLPERALVPGSYLFSIPELGVRRKLMLTSETKPFTIDVGPPITATFHFVDAKTQAPLAVTAPHWSIDKSASDPDVRAMQNLVQGIDLQDLTSKLVAPDASATHSFRVPAGTIWISAMLDDDEIQNPVAVEVRTEVPDVIVALRHLTGIRVVFRFDGKPIDVSSVEEAARKGRPEDYEFGLTVRPRHAKDPGNAAPTDSRPFQGGLFVAVERPGEYTVELPPIDDAQPIPPRDVTVVDQEITNVVYDLVQRKK